VELQLDLDNEPMHCAAWLRGAASSDVLPSTLALELRRACKALHLSRTPCVLSTTNMKLFCNFFGLVTLVFSMSQLASTVYAQEADAPAADAANLQVSPDDAPVKEPFDAPDKPSRWYGWQTLAADGLSLGVTTLGLFLASVSDGHPAGWPIAIVGLVGYTAITPLLHFSYDNPWMLPSLSLRAVAVALTVAGAYNFGRCISDDLECWDGAAAGVLLAAGPVVAVAATVMDAVLAVKPRAGSDTTWTPWVDPRTSAAGLSVSGRW
jgi:hypothetical protein